MCRTGIWNTRNDIRLDIIPSCKKLPTAIPHLLDIHTLVSRRWISIVDPEEGTDLHLFTRQNQSLQCIARHHGNLARSKLPVSRITEIQERKALEAERKKVEKEESKYNTEIEKLQNQLQSASSSELEQLNARILQLQAQLSEVVLKKEEISNLANGKAGNVYVISNLGSFGENVFKIGMTRRLNPQDRVDELGNASVPFKFDVHSFIFSDDAVGLESKLHEMLNQKRVNKVNMRKEFFNVTIDELEELVTEIEPTAEFNRTMAAEEYRQSLSTTENYSKNYVDTDEDDEELE